MTLPGLGRITRTLIRYGTALLGTAALCSGSACAGALSASIYPSGSSDFVLQVSQMSGVTGVEASITYDVSTLGNARINATPLLSRARVGTDTSQAGTLRLSAQSSAPMRGSGNLAILRFSLNGNAPGSILGASLYLTDTSGRQSSVPVTINNPADPKDAASKDDAPADAASPEPGGREAGGAAPSPLPESGRPATLPAETDPATAGAASSRDPGDARWGRVLQRLPDHPVVQVQSRASVLKRIRALPDKSNEPEIARLFLAERGQFTQHPAVALSDGSTAVTLVFKQACGGDLAPSFVISGAHCLALKPRGTSGWELEVMPDRGASAATVSVLCADSVLEYPLTVAPQQSEYLVGRREPGDPSLDIYVRVANMLANGSSSKSQAASDGAGSGP